MLKQIRKFVKRYKLARGSIDVDRLVKIIEQHGYSILKFNRYKNNPDIESILELLNLTETAKDSPSFIYADTIYRILFILNGLSDDEYEILYWHELAHIVLEHVYFPHNSIKEENDSHRFVMFTKAYIAGKHIMKYLLYAAAVVMIVFALTIPPNNDAENLPAFSTAKKAYPSGSKQVSVTAQPDKAPIPTVVPDLISTPIPTSTPSPIQNNVSTTAPTSTRSPKEAADYAGEKFSASEVVYVTKTGDRFHKHGCFHITNSSALMDLPINKALASKYTPCKDCYRELY